MRIDSISSSLKGCWDSWNKSDQFPGNISKHRVAEWCLDVLYASSLLYKLTLSASPSHFWCCLSAQHVLFDCNAAEVENPCQKLADVEPKAQRSSLSCPCQVEYRNILLHRNHSGFTWRWPNIPLKHLELQNRHRQATTISAPFLLRQRGRPSFSRAQAVSVLPVDLTDQDHYPRYFELKHVLT